MKLRAGVIGCGIGAAHVAAYQRNPFTEVTVVCDTDRARAEEIAREYGVPKIVTEYDLLLTEDIDLISVATPDQWHAEQCVAALETGLHVLCEKPLALTIEDCESIIAASDEAKGLFMIGQVCRFAPGFALAKSLLDDGIIGNLFLVQSEYAHNYAHARGVADWRLDPLRHPFVGGGCHAVDLLRWCAGNIAEVHAYANHFVMKDWPVDDCIVANFRFESDVIGQVMCSIGCQRPYTMRSCFYGNQGTLICDNTSDRIQLFSSRYPAKPNAFWDVPVAVDAHNIAREIEIFVDHVLHERPIAMDAREGARTVATCLAAVQSCESGEAVEVRNTF